MDFFSKVVAPLSAFCFINFFGLLKFLFLLFPFFCLLWVLFVLLFYFIMIEVVVTDLRPLFPNVSPWYCYRCIPQIFDTWVFLFIQLKLLFKFLFWFLFLTESYLEVYNLVSKYLGNFHLPFCY